MTETPHYLLFSESGCSQSAFRLWRFVLQDVSSNRRLIVSDSEPESRGERLELLAVVRGLEALDGPSRVTLVTKSRYVSRGFKYGLAEWRANDWRWERFGRFVPVKDHDLWQRVDRALKFHQVDCQAWQFTEQTDAAEVVPAPSSPCTRSEGRQRAWTLRTHRDWSRLRSSLNRTCKAGAATPHSKSRAPSPLRGSFTQRAGAWAEWFRSLGDPVRQVVHGTA